MSYHWKDGWMFARVLSDGSGDVEIWQRSTKGDPRIELHIPAAEWASIVASVSARGENAETYQAAVKFHNANAPTPTGEAVP